MFSGEPSARVFARSRNRDGWSTGGMWLCESLDPAPVHPRSGVIAEGTREVHYRFGQQRPARPQARLATPEQLPYRAPLPRITRLMALAIYWDNRLGECVDLDW